jgi:F-type H+-transporting ATPase subunit g
MSLLNQINQTASSSAAQPANMINTVRSMSTAQWASIGVVVAETIGFFTVGEMIGRFKLVGYRGKKAEH